MEVQVTGRHRGHRHTRADKATPWRVRLLTVGRRLEMRRLLLLLLLRRRRAHVLWMGRIMMRGHHRHAGKVPATGHATKVHHRHSGELAVLLLLLLLLLPQPLLVLLLLELLGNALAQLLRGCLLDRRFL